MNVLMPIEWCYSEQHPKCRTVERRQIAILSAQRRSFGGFGSPQFFEQLEGADSLRNMLYACAALLARVKLPYRSSSFSLTTALGRLLSQSAYSSKLVSGIFCRAVCSADVKKDEDDKELHASSVSVFFK